MITYQFLKQVSKSDVSDFALLLEQLTEPEYILTQRMVQETICGGDVLVARDMDSDSKIIGTVSLFKIPTLLGVDGLIENIVVDKKYRRRGIGQTLMEKMFEKARGYGWHRVEWTSGDYRTEALSFYRKIPKIVYRPQSRYVKVL